MADANTTQIVTSVVQQRVAAAQLFTAYDITVEARNQGARIRHGDAREVVHRMFQDGTMGASYQRSVVDIGIATNPFVYHPYDVDPSSYQSTASGAQATKPSTSGNPAPSQAGIVRRVLQTIWGGGSKNQSPARTSAPSQSTGRSGVPRRPVTLNLDASDYLPISREDLLDATKKMNVWASPWFGRRDLIPPVTDSRTKLIDRAMVANGLLTPEQLAKIHQVGAEMDHYNPNALIMKHQSALAGQAAVDEERKKKAEERRLKKEAAAARREERRKAIEHRKETDIIFLGRGVSSGLADRSSDLAKLQAADLPALSTPAEVAGVMEISVSQLRWLAYHNDVAARIHYVQFAVPKKSGGTRTLSSPHAKLRIAQQWVLDNVLSKLSTESAAHGFVPGRSIKTNAEAHVRREIVVNMDLAQFFPNITFPRVRALFVSLGYSRAVATIFALLCTECPRRAVTYAGERFFVATHQRGLPQGACTSPAISNQIARRLDRRLQGLAAKLQINYTRYADDLTFSGDQNLSERVGYVMACTRHVAQDEGFAINPKKTRVLRRNQSQVVTGLVVNDQVGVPKKKIKQIRAILHQAKTEGLEAQNRNEHPNFASYLEGYIAFIAMTRPELGAKMLSALRAVS